MPMFEYKCSQCGRVEEVLQKTAKVVKQTCPDCKKPMDKLFSSFAVGVGQAGSSKCISCTDRGCPHAGGMD